MKVIKCFKKQINESYLENIKNSNYWQHQVDYQLEHFGRVGAGLLYDLDENGFYLNVDNKVTSKASKDSDIKSKDVLVESKEKILKILKSVENNLTDEELSTLATNIVKVVLYYSDNDYDVVSKITTVNDVIRIINGPMPAPMIKNLKDPGFKWILGDNPQDLIPAFGADYTYPFYIIKTNYSDKYKYVTNCSLYAYMSFGPSKRDALKFQTIEEVDEFIRILNRAAKFNRKPELHFEAIKISSEDALNEDTMKNSKGKWVNKGKDGTHGEFRTKKAADAQRKAIFANGFGESLEDDVKADIADELDKKIEEIGLELDKLLDDENYDRAEFDKLACIQADMIRERRSLKR